MLLLYVVVQVYHRMSRLQESVVDCEASLEKDPGCLAAMLCRARYRDLS